MPANLQPIFPLTPNTSWGTVQAANTAMDGTGTVVTVFTAGANGARLDAIKVRALGTNVASVLRLWINNGGANSTPSNNSLFYEVSLPATTLTQVASTTDISLQFDTINLPQVVLPTGYKVNVTIGTAVAAGWHVTAFGGSY